MSTTVTLHSSSPEVKVVISDDHVSFITDSEAISAGDFVSIWKDPLEIKNKVLWAYEEYLRKEKKDENNKDQS